MSYKQKFSETLLSDSQKALGLNENVNFSKTDVEVMLEVHKKHQFLSTDNDSKAAVLIFSTTVLIHQCVNSCILTAYFCKILRINQLYINVIHISVKYNMQVLKKKLEIILIGVKSEVIDHILTLILSESFWPS